MEMKKGQVFVMSAIIFSSIVLLAVISTQESYTTTSDRELGIFFQSISERHPEIVDSSLKKDYSIEQVRKEFYTFNRFVTRRGNSKSLNYKAFQLVILPEKEKALMINYKMQTLSFSLHGSSWINETLDPYQNHVADVESSEYYFKSDDIGVEESFNASRPTVLGHIRLESGDSVMTDKILR